MTSILFVTNKIYSNQFKRNFVTNTNLLFRFSLASVKFKFNFQHFEKTDEPHGGSFLEIKDRK